MKYSFEIVPLLLPVFLPFGATKENSFADLSHDTLHVKLGFLFDEKIPLKNMAKVDNGTWNILFGLGHRMALGGKCGVLGSTKNVICITFKDEEFIKALGPFYQKTQYLYLALEEPQAFINDLSEKIANIN